MNILLCGGAGYIGSHMLRRLLRDGHGVVVLDNLSSGHRAALQGCELVVGDLLEKPLQVRVFVWHRFDAVMHFCAKSLVAESVREPYACQCRRYARSAGCDARARRAATGLFFDGGGVWNAAHRRYRRRPSAQSDQPVWTQQDDGRGHPARRSPCAWTAFGEPALLQRGRCRRGRIDRRGVRTGNAPDSERLAHCRCLYTAPTIRPATVPARAITCMSRILRTRISRRWRTSLRTQSTRLATTAHADRIDHRFGMALASMPPLLKRFCWFSAATGGARKPRCSTRKTRWP